MSLSTPRYDVQAFVEKQRLLLRRFEQETERQALRTGDNRASLRTSEEWEAAFTEWLRCRPRVHGG